MAYTQAAQWLQEICAPFDLSILGFLHQVAVNTGSFLTMFFRFVSLFADKGAFPILLGILLLFFPKKRWVGVSILFSIAFGVLLTNLIIKPLVARPRPYTLEMVAEWWNFVGAYTESSFSFPSGHASISMALFMGIVTGSGKKGYLPLFLLVVLMCLSRCYLMVHYPTDVIGGVIAGGLGGLLGWGFLRLLKALALRKPQNDLCRAFLSMADRKSEKRAEEAA